MSAALPAAARALAAVTPWVTALMLVCLLVRMLARGRVAAQTFRLVWLVLAIRLALPVDISLPAAPVQMQLPAAAAAQASPGAPEAPPAQQADSAGQAAPQEESGPAGLSWPELAVALPYVWAAGALVFLAFHAGAYVVFLSQLCARRVRETDDAVCSAVWLAFGRKTCIYRAAGLASPMLAGLWRPAVYLPEEVQVSELPYVLEHEASHREARDILYVFLLMAANAVHWFNPAVYAMVRTARRDMELACDEAVLEGRPMEYRVAYGQAVLDTLKRGRLQGPLALNFAGGKHALKERFARMVEQAPRRRARGLVTATACCVAAASLCVAFAVPAQQIAPVAFTQAWADGQWRWPVPEYGTLGGTFEEGAVGVTIQAPEGSPVVAARGGIVASLQVLGLPASGGPYGNALVIYHGDGSGYSLYANCGDIYAQLGDTVTAGQPVATVGSLANEMLFALWAQGDWVDPMEYLAAVQPQGEVNWARLAQLKEEIHSLQREEQVAGLQEEIRQLEEQIDSAPVMTPEEQARNDAATRELQKQFLAAQQEWEQWVFSAPDFPDASQPGG